MPTEDVDDSASGQREAISFGPFRLVVAERRLETASGAVHLGGRALDVLIYLVERAGEVVSKQDILDRVWPNIAIDDASLRVHIAALRKTLSANRTGDRYVATVSGRGYSFVAPISRTSSVRSATAAPISDGTQTLPPPLKRIIGRGDVVERVSKSLLKDRFVTIVGPGGIGKTTIAVWVAYSVSPSFDGSVYFFDLGPLSDPQLVPSAIASTLGLVVQSQDATPSLITFLRDKRLLLILDSCEHVIESAARLAERIFVEAPQVHILATSREALRVEGERVYQLPALKCPPEDAAPTAAEVLAFPASQLFVEKVVASGHRLTPDDAEAGLIGEICRRLDGIALAIELAAGCVRLFGLKQTAALLDSRFELLQQGKRTALARHQTLRATLDWSYELLTAEERIVLRRLAVFVGYFTLEAARSVAADGEISEERVTPTVASLVAKSLVSAETSSLPRYRLLDTTRAYVMQKLIESDEADAIARRHAVYFQALLGQLSQHDVTDAGTAHNRRDLLGNVRAALEWTFLSSCTDIGLRIALAAVAVRYLLSLSLLTDCARWAERAIGILDAAHRGTAAELELQAALGLSLMFTRGNSSEARIALVRALDLAEALRDFSNQLRLVGQLHIFHERIGEYSLALKFAQQSVRVAAELGDPTGIAEAHAAMGISRHLEGETLRARAHLEAALVTVSEARNINAFHLGFDFRNRAKIALARTQWLQGLPEQAMATARQTVDEARASEHPITHCIALIWAVSVFTWSGRFSEAEAYIDRFLGEANRHSLAPYQAAGRGLQAQLLIKRGDLAGMDLLRAALEAVHLNRYELMTSEFKATLAEGLLAGGKSSEALLTAEAAITAIDANGDLFMKPELLRIKADILAADATGSHASAEATYRASIALAQSQSAASWELRTATSFAHFLSGRDRGDAGRETLAAAYLRFNEGFDTLDLQAARRVLDGPVDQASL